MEPIIARGSGRPLRIGGTIAMRKSRFHAEENRKRETLPLKVWSDCVRCPKRDGCDEIAVVMELPDVVRIDLPAAPPTPRGVSIPVLEYVESED